MPSMYVVVDAISNQHRDYLTNLFQYYNKDPYAIVNDLSSFCANNQTYSGVQRPQVQTPALAPALAQAPAPTPLPDSSTVLNTAITPSISPALSSQNYVDGYFANMYSNNIGNSYMENPCLYGTPDVNLNYYGFNPLAPSTEYNSNITNTSALNYNNNQYSPAMAYTSGNMSRRSDEGFFSESSFASCSTPSNADSSCSTPPNASSVCANSPPSGPYSPALVNDVSSEERTSTAGSKFALWAVLCDAIMEPQYSGAVRIVSKVLDRISFTITDMDAATKILSNYATSPNLKGRISTYLWNAVQKGMLKKAKVGKEVVYVFTETALESMSYFLEKKDLTLDDFFKTVQDIDCSTTPDLTVYETENDVSRKRGKSGVIWETIVDCLIDPHNSAVEFFGCDGYQIGFSINRVENLSDAIFGNRGLSRGEKTRKLRILLWNGTNTQKYIERVNGSLSNYFFTDRSKRMLVKLLSHKNLTVNDLKMMGQRVCSKSAGSKVY